MNNISSSPYIEKLKDPRWQKVRLQIFERDKFKCCFCGDSEAELHCHHTRYEYGKDPWDYPFYLLMTLCKVCHQIETDFRKKGERTILENLRWVPAFELNHLGAALLQLGSQGHRGSEITTFLETLHKFASEPQKRREEAI